MRTRPKSKLISTALAFALVVAGLYGQKVFASDSNQKADTLNRLGLFLGTGTGYQLEKQVTRSEAAVMLVRLLGKEKEAQNGNYSHPFIDVPKWADKYIAYMYDGGLTKGVSNKRFDPNGLCNLQMYAAFMLRALDYEDGVDFTYGTAEQTAYQIGLAETVTESFLRGDMVAVSYYALAAKLKNSDNTLLDKLVADVAVDAEAAQPVQRLFATDTGESDADDNENGPDSTNDHVGNGRIKLSFGNEEVIVNMYDNPTSRDFLTMLPRTLSFEEYVGKEKISYLPRKLSIEPAPSNSGPTVGDFAYYSPWGNLAIFYNGTGTAENGLIVLGEIESGKEHLASMSDDFTITIERLD